MNVLRACVPNSIQRISNSCLSFMLAFAVFALAAEAKPTAKTPAKKQVTTSQKSKTTKSYPAPQKKPASLKPMTGAQMDTYVPTPQVSQPRPSSATSDFSGDTKPAQSRMLTGSAEHSETLPAEDSRFAAGSTFDERALPDYKSGNNWFWLPTWFAGNYKTDTLTRVYRYDYETGKTDLTKNTYVVRRTEKWGWQQDRSGGIWQYDSTPYKSNIDRGASREIQLCKERVPVRMTAESATLRFRTTAIIINRQTEKIEWTNQSEYLQTYRPVGPNRIKVEISAKTFDANGRPLYIDKNIQYLDRITGFEPMDTLDGKDLRVMFRDFLLAHNRADLIPDSRSGF